jgi:hypothetical protein
MDALSQASDNTIRAILTALCDDTGVRKKAVKYLNMLEPEAMAKSASLSTNQSNDKKRKAALALNICVQCDAPFYEGDQTDKCKYHSGQFSFPFCIPHPLGADH